MTDISAVKKRLALITGATGGIGGAIAEALVKTGYTLIIHGRSQDKLDKMLEQLPGEHFSIVADISHTIECKTLIDRAYEIGAVELLVNNAGLSHFADFTSVSLTDADTGVFMQVNLIAPMLLSKRLINKASHKVTIVNVGSALGSIGFPGFSVYCASKFGLRGFSETLSREYALDETIRIAYFAPRTTETNINSKAVADMNRALNSKVDSPKYVAKQFMKLLNSNKRRKVVGWPEKLFARINGVLPELVDKAFKKKIQKIKQFSHASTGDTK